MSESTVSMEALKAFVRKEASRFLQQENVTSVGIGYKIKDGKPAQELSIQFTVRRKVAPEGLESIGATELPKSFPHQRGGKCRPTCSSATSPPRCEK